MKRLGSVLIALFFVGTLSISAQTKYTIQADQAYEAQLYAQAAELYKKASTKEKIVRSKKKLHGEWRNAIA